MDAEIDSLLEDIAAYLPSDQRKRKVYVTITYAQSIDGRVAGRRGERTKISGPASSKMTHFLRAKHDAILVGKNTLVVDDPGLNCRYPGCKSSPTPILLDSLFSWGASEKEWNILKNARLGVGQPPYLFTLNTVNLELEPFKQRKTAIEEVGGKVLQLPDMKWPTILSALEDNGIESLMIEGGATVIGSSLEANISDAIIVTIGSNYLGISGVEAAPTAKVALKNVKWASIGDDCILCARQVAAED